MVDILDYSSDVKINDGLAAGGGFEEGEVSGVVVEEVFTEGAGAGAHNRRGVPGEPGIGPGAFTPNMIDVWAYDVEKGDSRVFKVMRIHSVEATETPWAFEDKHEVKKPDVFRMIGSPVEKVVLQLNTSAKSLLLEEFPLAEKDIKREDGKWILRTVIHSLEGAGRFVIGLAADVKILEGEALRKYILDYQKKYIQKL